MDDRGKEVCRIGRAFVLIAGLFLPLVSGFSFAQNASLIERDAAEQRRAMERETLNREQQDRVQDVHLQSPSTHPSQTLSESESPCFPIKDIKFQGNDTEYFDWLRRALNGKQGADDPLKKCLGSSGINLLLQRAQDTLIERGYITSRVLISPQDLSSGTLLITVFMGRVHDTRFVEPLDPHRPAFNVFSVNPNDILNLRDIEQSLENLKRVPTAEADIQITPAQKQGESDLLITYQQINPIRFLLSVDDSGTKSTGKYQGSATISWDNIASLSELFYLTINRDIAGNDAKPHGTQGGTLHYSLPFGYWLLGTTLSRSSYFQTVAGTTQDYIYSGSSSNADIKLSRLIYRDAIRKTTMSLKAFVRESQNFIDDLEVEVQRRRVGGWEFGIGHKEFIMDATLEGNLSYRRGTGSFGTLPAPEEIYGEGTSLFSLIVADASFIFPFKFNGQKWRYNTNWRAQFNQTPLTPQDRFAIGGRYTVRGFDGESSLIAERGWYSRNDLSLLLGDSGQEIYIGLDHGEVAGPSSELLVGTVLTGSVFGLRGATKGMQYDIFVGKPIFKPNGFKTPASIAGFILNYSF